MGVGIVDRTTGTRNIRQLPLIANAWPGFTAVVLVGAASMAGLPPLLGFISKEAGYAAVLDSGMALGAALTAVVIDDRHRTRSTTAAGTFARRSRSSGRRS